MSSTKSKPKAPTTETPSEFYFACRNNEIDKVKAMLPKLTLKEIDRMEPNGSTALHAAAYYGNKKIVELLLSKGAKLTIKNQYGSTPVDEAKGDDIKKLLQSAEAPKENSENPSNNENTASFEWIFIKGDPASYAAFNRDSLWKCDSKQEFQRLSRGIREEYIHENGPLAGLQGIEEVRSYIDQAISENDPTYVARAYTAPTAFFSRLNRDLSQLPTNWSGDKHERNFASILIFHPVFKPYAYQGESYRGMVMSSEDLKQYVVDSIFMNKTFLSSSTDPSKAEWFANLTKSSSVFRVICKYIIKNIGTAIKVEEFSVFKDEKEVLILPYAIFKVKDIRKSEGKKDPVIEIDVEENTQNDSEEDCGESHIEYINKKVHKSTHIQMGLKIHKGDSSDKLKKLFNVSDLDGFDDEDTHMSGYKKQHVEMDNQMIHGKFKGNGITIKHKDFGFDSDDESDSNVVKAKNHQSFTIFEKFNPKDSFNMKQLQKCFDSDDDD